MFFDANPKDFEPLEKEQLDAMLEAWELEMFGESASGRDGAGNCDREAA